MYSGSGYSDWEIGDVDVIVHDGQYHLFHLIIPNHDYIAHAVSDDGIQWERVKNALFVGHPGEWDDDMLWTMQVSKISGHFHMHYTGLQRKDRGQAQKIGLAMSKDLIHWEKITDEGWPVSSQAPYYESRANNPRGWLSFRDPFYYRIQGKQYLLVCARSSDGPVSRRGCIGILELSRQPRQLLPPLCFPRVYDDVECPCAFEISGVHYLMGSIREDIKVRYWYASEFFGHYRSFRSDVLLPQGNYAARIVKDNGHWLVYNFFFTDGEVNSRRVLPPPKQIESDGEGKLLLKSYYRWEEKIRSWTNQKEITDIRSMLRNDSASMMIEDHKWIFESKSGYEIFLFKPPSSSFIWEGCMEIVGEGKFGLISDMDDEGNGYFLSFDTTNGLAQIRAWGFNPANNQKNFVFNNIQSNIFKTKERSKFKFRLIRFGNYIELGIDDLVCLTLIDYHFETGRIGLYTASSTVYLTQIRLAALPSPPDEYGSQKEMLQEH